MSAWFRYRAVEPGGQLATGTVAAPDQTEAMRMLGSRRLLVLELAPADPPGVALSRTDQARVLRTVATLLESGSPIDRALRTAADILGGEPGRAIDRILDPLSRGQPLSSSMGNERGWPPVVVGLVAGGERAGRLAASLDRAAGYLEAEAELRSAVWQASAYPAVLIFAGTASLGFLLWIVVPRFSTMFDGGAPLPLGADLLLGVSTALRETMAPLVPLLGLLVAAGMTWLRTDPGRAILSGLVDRLPHIGRLRWFIASERFCRAFGELMAAGVPVLQALDHASTAASLGRIRAATRLAAERVRNGQPVAAALEAETVLPQFAVHLLTLGEASGRMAQLSTRAADELGRTVRRNVRVLVGLIEPLVVVVFGGLIALVAAALLQAVYSLRPGVP